MKKGAVLSVALALTLACAAGAMAEETAFVPGTYESEAEGFGGPSRSRSPSATRRSQT